MSVKQISIFLENKPGELGKLTKLFTDNGINMQALYLSENRDFGIVRVIVDKMIDAVGILRDADFVARLSSVLAYAVPNEPGGLNVLLKTFTETGINIDYMYAFNGGDSADKSYIILSVDDHEAAEEQLRARGLQALTQEDLKIL